MSKDHWEIYLNYALKMNHPLVEELDEAIAAIVEGNLSFLVTFGMTHNNNTKLFLKVVFQTI